MFMRWLLVPHVRGLWPYGHVGLALFAPVLERIEQPGIHSCPASQILGIDLIGLALALA